MATLADKLPQQVPVKARTISWPAVAWFGILYYAFTEDVRWYVAGLLILGLSFLVFPIRKSS